MQEKATGENNDELKGEGRKQGGKKREERVDEMWREETKGG